MAIVATSTQQKLGVNSFIQEFQTYYNKGRGKSKNKDCRRSATIRTKAEKTAVIIVDPHSTTHRGNNSHARGASLECPSW